MNYQDIFWNNIQKVQDILALNNAEVAELFEMSSSEFMASKIKNESIDLQRMDSFLDRVGMTIDSFFEGRFDKNQIQNFYFGKLDSLPTRYDFAKFSKARTIINCLAYIELKYGTEFKNSIVRSLNMDIRFFEDPERVMNIRLLRDLCSILRRFGLTDSDFTAMGKMSHETNRQGSLGKSFREHNNVEDLIADVCENHSKCFDQNFDYFITHKDIGEISVGFRPTENILEYLDSKEIVSDEVCITKRGVFGSFPQYLNYQHTHTIKTKCMLQGDSFYEYTIFYS